MPFEFRKWFPFNGPVVEPRVNKAVRTFKELKQVCENLKNNFKEIGVNMVCVGQVVFQIQLTSHSDLWNINPLGMDLKLGPFYDLMRSEIVKVVYDHDTSFEFLWHALDQEIPPNVFDIKVAAMYCGINPLGYNELVKKLIDKDIREQEEKLPHSWSNEFHCSNSGVKLSRNVGPKHLLHLYIGFCFWLNVMGNMAWFTRHMSELRFCRERYENLVWRRIDCRIENKRQLAVLIEVARLRERLARKNKTIPKHIMTDLRVCQVAKVTPGWQLSYDAMFAYTTFVAGLKEKVERAVDKGMSVDLETLPEVPLYCDEDVPNDMVTATARFLDYATDKEAAKYMICKEVIVSRDDLKKIAKANCLGYQPERLDLPIMQGWWREVFGKAVLGILRWLSMRDDRSEFLSTFSPTRYPPRPTRYPSRPTRYPSRPTRYPPRSD